MVEGRSLIGLFKSRFLYSIASNNLFHYLGQFVARSYYVDRSEYYILLSTSLSMSDYPVKISRRVLVTEKLESIEKGLVVIRICRRRRGGGKGRSSIGSKSSSVTRNSYPSIKEFYLSPCGRLYNSEEFKTVNEVILGFFGCEPLFDF